VKVVTVQGDGTGHSCHEHQISTGTGASSLGDWITAGNLFRVIGPLSAKLHWPVKVWVHGTRRAANAVECGCKQPSVEASGTHS